MDIIIVVGFLIAIGTAFAALEAEDRIVSIIYLLAATTVVGLLFLYVGALFSGVFQLLVYSGVMTVLFAATAYFLESYSVTDESVGQVEVDLSG